MKILLLINFLSLFLHGYSQNYTTEEKLQGYATNNENITFIFDPTNYNVNPEKVTVTGKFREWDASIDNDAWQLKKANDLWLLTKNNSEHKTIQPNTKFKFRMNGGDWMQPPAEASNKNDFL